MNKQRLLELAGAPLSETRDMEQAKGFDSFRTAIRTIASELIAKADMSMYEDGEDVADELLAGRWVEMLRDEINDQLQDEHIEKQAPDLDPHADSEMAGGKEQEETVTHDYMQANPDPTKTM